MSRVVRDKRSWLVALGLAVVAGVVVPLMVLGSGPEPFTATPYADVIRFEAQGVASLQVQIFDLSGRRLWDSGIVSGRVVDWNRANTWGERLAYGAYLYQAQGWNAQGAVVFQKTGKLALLPGDKVQLQSAPSLQSEPAQGASGLSVSTTQPMGGPDFGSATVICGKLGIGTASPATTLHVRGSITVGSSVGGNIVGDTVSGAWTFAGGPSWNNGGGMSIYGSANPTNAAEVVFRANGTPTVTIKPFGNVGIGTASPAGRLDVRNTASQPALRLESSAGTNLIEGYNTGTGSATGLIFRVERATGNVRADGAFYGAGFYTGSADVAEHINASEILEPGDVVEIDPDNPKHFRLARTPGSRLVAGVISTQPGVVLGSNSDPVAGDVDPRPVLALAGRVPVKATTENGPIQVGDLLIASSTPGRAMRCTDHATAVGAVIGKALEPLDEGTGLIMIQVTLR